MKRKKQSLRIIKRAAAAAGVNLLLIAVALYGVMFVLARGPSETAKRLFVLSVKETSAVGFLADLFLSDKEIADILSEKDAVAAVQMKSGIKTDVSLIEIPDKEKTNVPEKNEETGDTDSTAESMPAAGTAVTGAPAAEIPETDDDGIEEVKIDGVTYKGSMLVVSDPKRIILGTPDKYGEDCTGLSLREMMKKYGAVAGINAGGFYDPDGQGTGGIPTGIIIKDGEIIYGASYGSYNLIGFDGDGILHVGTMTGREALDAGVAAAVSFGPALVINGEPCNSSGNLGGGFNPRTAIGQRKDGAVLLLVIEGRNLGSLGCTYDDLVEVMLAHGAINASNLDGGSSSLMLYNGRNLTKSAYVYGERIIASAFLVK